MTTSTPSTIRKVSLSSPLGDLLHITAFTGREALSELFSYRIEVVAEAEQSIDFDSLLGNDIAVAIEQQEVRHLHGIVRRVGYLGENVAQAVYVLDVVPRFWLWTQRVRCQIFQDQTTPQILQQVLAGLDARFELSSDYRVHTYRTQYRESDYQFACRLMEDEGIYYFFEHDASGHRLVLADNSPMSATIAGGPMRFTGHSSGPDEPRVRRWQKFQELRPARVTLWDHSFQLPDQNLEASRAETATVAAGKVAHQPGLGGKMNLEIFDYPGGYGHRFDGIDAAGNQQPSELREVFKQNERTARLRLEEQSAAALRIEAAGDDSRLIPGWRFGLVDHRDAEGDYVVTWVEHDVRVPSPRSGEGERTVYGNRFGALPLNLTFRPPRITARPRPEGSQTATVVGPKGETVHCDPFGRIKIHFHWDRTGQRDGSDSCWVRVASPWAGGGFGMVSLPRVGHEVVVTFLDGDLDRPLVTGSVYNADRMPPMPLPEKREFSTITSQSLHGDPNKVTAVTIQDLVKEKLFLQAGDEIVLDAGNQISVTVPDLWTSRVGSLQIQGVGWHFPKFTGGAWKKEGGWERTEQSVGDFLQDMYGGTRIDTTKGTHGNYCLGLADQVTLFTRNEVTIDPMSWVNDDSRFQSFFHNVSKYAFGGNRRRVIYGDHHTLGYGSRLNVQSGQLIGLVGSWHTWKLMAKVHAVLATSTCLLPGLYNLTGNSKLLDAYRVASLLISIYVLGKFISLQRVYAKEQAFQSTIKIFEPFALKMIWEDLPAVASQLEELCTKQEADLLGTTQNMQTHMVHGSYTIDAEWLGVHGRQGIFLSVPNADGNIGILTYGNLMMGGPNGNMLLLMNKDSSKLTLMNGTGCQINMTEDSIELKAGNAKLTVGPTDVKIDATDVKIDAFTKTEITGMDIILGKASTKGKLKGTSWNVE